MLREYDRFFPCDIRGECIDAWVEVNGIRIESIESLRGFYG